MTVLPLAKHTMNTIEPTIGTFLDCEEQAIHNLIECDDFILPPSIMSEEKKSEIINSIRAKYTKIKK